MTIQTKWRLGLSLLTGLLAPELAGAGWFHFACKRADEEVHRFLEVQWNKVKLSSEALRYSYRNNRITMQVFLLKDREEIAPLLLERGRNTDRITELLNQIEKGATADPPFIYSVSEPLGNASLNTVPLPG
jgi:hypothetical protein